MESEQIAWAAGLIEGEGCFCIVRNSKAKGKQSSKILVQMNDLDVLERLQSLFQVGKVYHRPPRGNSRESWCWTVYRADDILLVIEAVFPWLGIRRKQKATEVKNWIYEQRGIH